MGTRLTQGAAIGGWAYCSTRRATIAMPAMDSPWVSAVLKESGAIDLQGDDEYQCGKVPQRLQ